MTLEIQVIPKSVQAAIVETFKVMAQETAEVVSVTADDANFTAGQGIVSVLTAKSDQFQGTLAIYFPAATYVPLMNKLLGEKQTAICAENADGVSEFLNIIYGTARNKINEAGFNFQPAIPATVKGQNLELPKGGGAKIMKFGCKCGFGEFVVALALTAK
jgi:CheY-specific phosphatase CheX